MTRRPLTVLLFAAALGSAIVPRGATAQDAPTGPTPPRLGFVDGEVSFWRPGAQDWSPAQVNTPLAEGDEVYAADGANVELQIGPRAFVRAGGDTQIGLETLDADTMQYEVNGGHVAFDVKRMPPGQSLEVDTPKASFRLDRPGYYRVDVGDDQTVLAVRRGGGASATGENGETYDVADEQRLVLGNDAGRYGVERVADPDEWDRWNYDRTGQLAPEPRSAQYVPPDVAGVDDLDRYGDWQDEPRYGRVWRPREVAADWTPYSTGRWTYDPYYEWTWVDDAPWGWCPYHYGRWVHFDDYWGWAPGPVVVRPAYSPALVAFFGAPGIGVSVGVGPLVSWVPLGFGEPVLPWWGGSRWSGRPYWGGWGGPRVVNNVVVNNFNVNGRDINRYQNMDVRHAIVGVGRDGFGRRGGHVFVDHPNDLRPMRGRLDVQPAAQSFVPRDGRGRRPPDRFQTRPIVTTRQARDPMNRLRERGIEAAASPTRRAEARVVRPGAPARDVVRGAPNAPARMADGMVAPERRGLNARRNEGAPRVPDAPRGRMRGEQPRVGGEQSLRPPQRFETGRNRRDVRPDVPNGPRDSMPTPMPRGDRARNERRPEPPVARGERAPRPPMRGVERERPTPGLDRRVEQRPQQRFDRAPAPERRVQQRPEPRFDRQPQPERRAQQRPEQRFDRQPQPERRAERRPEPRFERQSMPERRVERRPEPRQMQGRGIERPRPEPSRSFERAPRPEPRREAERQPNRGGGRRAEHRRNG